MPVTLKRALLIGVVVFFFDSLRDPDPLFAPLDYGIAWGIGIWFGYYCWSFLIALFISKMCDWMPHKAAIPPNST